MISEHDLKHKNLHLHKNKIKNKNHPPYRLILFFFVMILSAFILLYVFSNWTNLVGLFGSRFEVP